MPAIASPPPLSSATHVTSPYVSFSFLCTYSSSQPLCALHQGLERLLRWEQSLLAGATPSAHEISDASDEMLEKEGKSKKAPTRLHECWEEGLESCPLVLLAPLPHYPPLFKKEESNRLSQLLKVSALDGEDLSPLLVNVN